MMLPILSLNTITNYCKFTDMVTNINAMGQCITQTSTFGFPEIVAFAFIGILAYLVAKEQLPAGVSIPAGMVLFYTLNLIFPGPILFALFILSVIAGGIMISAAILRFIMR
jgi:hypothetical protein